MMSHHRCIHVEETKWKYDTNFLYLTVHFYNLQMLPCIVEAPIHALTSSQGIYMRGENLCNVYFLVRLPHSHDLFI